MAAPVMFSDRVAVACADHIADVRLSRPAKLNALDLEMFEALVEAAEFIAKQSEVRAVILSGEGAAFCAGIDLSLATELMSADMLDLLINPGHGDCSLFQRAALAWHDLPIPVIAALHGVVFGGGLQIALAADMRFCSSETRLSIMEMRWAIVPDMGASVLLPALVGHDTACDLTYTARVIDAPEARHLGLITRICESPLDEARAVAAGIARSDPRTMRAAKRLLNGSAGRDRAARLRAERDEQTQILHSGGFTEALSAHAEGRAPRYDQDY